MKSKPFLSFILLSALSIWSCKTELYEFAKETHPLDKSGKREGILNISYEITSFRDYDADFSKLSSLDLSYLNPGSEKQRVEMVLLESGQMNLTITELNFEREISIPHKALPDDSPKIVKTEIIGNIASFYDANGKLLGTEKIPLPNHKETVERIRDIGTKFSTEDINSTIATMQGHQFIDNLEEFIRNAPKHGAQVLEHGKDHVTLRMPFSMVDPRMQGAAVVLIDKNLNKMAGTRIYDAQDNLIQSVYFGYFKGEVQTLNAIRVEQKMPLPSGKEVKLTTNSKIENLQFQLNI